MCLHSEFNRTYNFRKWGGGRYYKRRRWIKYTAVNRIKWSQMGSLRLRSITIFRNRGALKIEYSCQNPINQSDATTDLSSVDARHRDWFFVIFGQMRSVIKRRDNLPVPAHLLIKELKWLLSFWQGKTFNLMQRLYNNVLTNNMIIIIPSSLKCPTATFFIIIHIVITYCLLI